MTTRTTQTNAAALQAYAHAMAQIAESLTLLTAYVEDHGGVGPDEVHWGHVGSAADIAARLAEMTNNLPR